MLAERGVRGVLLWGGEGCVRVFVPLYSDREDVQGLFRARR